MVHHEKFFLGFVGLVGIIAILTILLVGAPQGSESDENLFGDASFSKIGIRGFIDIFTTEQIAGWAYDTTQPNAEVNIHIYIDGTLKKTVVAKQPRPDVNTAFSIPGNHGFSTSIKEHLIPGKIHRVQIVGENNGKQRTLAIRKLRLEENTPLANNAVFVRQEVPLTMEAGKTYTISITMKNTGTSTWQSISLENDNSDVLNKRRYFLGTQSPQDNMIWGLKRVPLPITERVLPGQEHTFAFSITAPRSAGTQEFQWQMVEEGREWFGEKTPLQQIIVKTEQHLLSASPNPCTVYPGQTQCAVTLSWPRTDEYGHPFVQLWNQDDANVSCAPANEARTLVRQVAPGQPKSFRLYPATSCQKPDAQTTNGALGSLTITAVLNSGTFDATFTSIQTPEMMITNQPYPVSVTVRNTGSQPWIGGQLSLRSVNIHGPSWNPGVVQIPPGVTVSPGGTYTFQFPVTPQTDKSVLLFSWRLFHEGTQQYFGPEMEHVWVVTDTPYTGTPPTRTVNIWEYIVGDPTTKMCLDGNQICQTIYPQGPNAVLVVRNDTLIVKYAKSEALNMIGVMKDGIAPSAVNANVQLRCLTLSPGSCDDGSLPSMPLIANVPVLPASAVNRHLVTEEGLDSHVKKTFWWNPVNYQTCQVAGTAGSIVHSGKIFLLESYDFGGDVGVQQDVLVYEGLGGYPTDQPLSQVSAWNAIRMERYLFVKGKGYYQEDGIEDPDCRDSTSTTTCNGIYSRFTSFEPATWRWIQNSPVPFVEYCPNI